MFRRQPLVFLSFPDDKESAAVARVVEDTLRGVDFETFRAEYVPSNAPLQEHIQQAIRRADAIVADVSGSNPSATFELGLAVGLQKPMLLMARKSEPVPSFLMSYQIARYQSDDLDPVRKYVQLWARDVVHRSAES